VDTSIRLREPEYLCPLFNPYILIFSVISQLLEGGIHLMNKKAIGIGLLVLGLSLSIVLRGQAVGNISGIIFMIFGFLFLVLPGKTSEDFDKKRV
jgi:hypothetical protein